MRLSEFRFKQVGPQLTNVELVAFEKEIGGEIDRGLREFLLVTNGGVASPLLQSSIPTLEFEIGLFLGLEPGYCQIRRSYFDLEEAFEESAPAMKRVLPFALDFGDGAICVVPGTASSEIVYVPTIGSLADDDINVEVIPIAKSFEKFVDTLGPFVDEHEV